jgi:hypothetical protein
VNQRPRIPWKRCIENAIRDLKIGGTDCLVLTQIMLEEADLSLPLVRVMEKRWRFWRQNKQYQLVADQVQTMSSECVEYLELRMKEACKEIEPPPDPWNLLADYVGAIRPEELRSAADQVRGVLETIAGVIAPDPPDLEAMKLVGEIVLQFLNENGPQTKKLLHQNLIALSADDTVMSDIDEFHGILRDIAKCLEQGQPNKIREILVTARQVLDRAGKAMQNKLSDGVSANNGLT